MDDLAIVLEPVLACQHFNQLLISHVILVRQIHRNIVVRVVLYLRFSRRLLFRIESHHFEGPILHILVSRRILFSFEKSWSSAILVHANKELLIVVRFKFLGRLA